jgi:hypothetical protein
MARLLLAAAGIFFVGLARAALPAEPLLGWDSTSTFTTSVTDAELRDTPSWNGEGNPPLSARKAMRSLTPVKDSLVHNEKEFKPWRLSSLSLKQSDRSPNKWYWCACYESFVDFKGGFATGEPHTLYLIVLMDGHVLKPTVAAIK